MGDPQTLRDMQTDPEYVGVIMPDEARFIDLPSMKMVVGVDFVVVDSGHLVGEHGRDF